MRHVRSLIYTLLLLLLIGGGGAYFVYQHYAADLPDYQQLVDYYPPTMTRVHAGDGRVVEEYGTQKRVFVPISAIPPRVIQAVLAAEDREFYQHAGINPSAILRAALQDALRVGEGRRGVGASTITQQVVKNMLLSNEYKLSRKIKEAILAVRLEQALSKDRILELYLNEQFFGQNSYGIAEAAQSYFNKTLDQLDIAEAALLAGELKGASEYDPRRHPDAARNRRDYVIDGMVVTGAISQAEADAAKAQPIALATKRDETQVFPSPYFAEEVRRELIQRYGEDNVYQGGLSVRTSLSPLLQTYAEKALRDRLTEYDRKHGWRGPVKHIELVDERGWIAALKAVPPTPGAEPWRQALVRDVTKDGAAIGFTDGAQGSIPMAELAWARPWVEGQRVGAAPKTADQVLKRGDIVLVEPSSISAKPIDPPNFALRQIPDVSGAMVALDPHTGRVLAMVGGWSFEMSKFNRVTQAKRQIGSTFKPFAFLAALENGMTPSTLILADPVQIYQGPGLPVWEPKNFKGEESSGIHTLRFAIEQSINTMTARMAAEIGIQKIKPYIERLGIMDEMPPYYSMVLGAGETTPMRLAAAYGMLDNGGRKITPTLIDRVQDRYGRTIFRADARDCARCNDPDWAPPGQVPPLPDDREQVLDPGTAFQMVHILEGVIQRGTAAAIGAKLKMPLAGKTGTTNGPNDTWFMGFSPDLVVGIYVGFDQPKDLGPGEQGSRTAAPAFLEFMTDALKDKPAVDFRIPPGIRLVRVNLTNGKLADPSDTHAIWEAFKPDTEPSDEVVDGGEAATVVSDEGGAAPALSVSDEAADPDANGATPVSAGTAQAGAQPGAAPGVLQPGTILNQRPHPTATPSTSTTGLY
jgi:penicillin-binding protein 1A